MPTSYCEPCASRAELQGRRDGPPDEGADARWRTYCPCGFRSPWSTRTAANEAFNRHIADHRCDAH